MTKSILSELLGLIADASVEATERNALIKKIDSLVDHKLYDKIQKVVEEHTPTVTAGVGSATLAYTFATTLGASAEDERTACCIAIAHEPYIHRMVHAAAKCKKDEDASDLGEKKH